MLINNLVLFLSLLSLTIWIVLVFFWGGFWWRNRELEETYNGAEIDLKSVCAVVPARNEAEVLPISLKSLLQQDYSGSFRVILVDDNSTDGTATVAQEVAESLGETITLADNSSENARLHILSAEPLPKGWTGKLWALEQGTRYALNLENSPDYLLLTDADIDRDRASLHRLVAKALAEDLDLVSLMVKLRVQSFWENLLIPAFIFFFQKLYPFPWVNNPHKSTAAAAGGCILIKKEALTRIGGISAIKDALIDDCALGKAIKGVKNSSPPYHKIWLGLTQNAHSLRPYDSLKAIWDMVARTAYTQLYYSPFLLLGTLLGMTLVYLVPPVSVVWGSATGNWVCAIAGSLPWILMSIAYLPTLRFYNCSPFLALCLPGIAFLYTLMTLDSAIRHLRGKGGNWKGRVY
ncbi:glycosyltransferase [Lusitaniella coriacea LEGE 07167]